MALASAINIRDTRANQPAASAAYAGCFYIVSDESEKIERCDGSSWLDVRCGTLIVLTADPSAPANGEAWLFDDGGSPDTISLKYRKGGVTHAITLGTI